MIFVNAVLIHKVGALDAAPAVLFGVNVTVVVAVKARLQVPLLTLVKFNVVFDVTAVTVTFIVPPAPIVAVPEAAPVYVTMFPAVPVIVKIAFAPEQIGLLDVRVAAAGVAGCALITTLADATEVHPAEFVTV